MNEWISIKDKLPEKGVMVLVAIYGTDIIRADTGEIMDEGLMGICRVDVGFLSDDGWCGYDGFPEIIAPSYWMPMPKPPKDGGNETVRRAIAGAVIALQKECPQHHTLEQDMAGTLGDMGEYARKVLRHEIVHAFLAESGLNESAGSTESWAMNEEMVDWIARQGPKIFEAWRSVGALDAEQDVKVEPNIFDKEEIHKNCTVQILTNTATGAVSVGWWKNET